MSFCLIICEIFNENIHGIDENSDSTIQGHYLVTYNISRINAEYELPASNSLINDAKPYLNICKKFYKNTTYKSHSLIQNYENIISKPNYVQLQIAKVIYLSGYECVAILKTFWIRIIQRTWKKIYKQKCIILAIRKLPSSLVYKQTHSKWPNNCLYMPSLYGMLTSIASE
jgi:hypothetical protein